MKTRYKILIGVAAVVAVFLGIVAAQPSAFTVARTATIAAAPSAVFAQVNDFHKWEAWSPWAKLDPAAKNTYSGAPAGAGAVFAWDGNDQVGAGSMTLVESQPGALIKIKLEFVRPFAGSNDVLFVFKPEEARTVVTWSMSGEKNFLSKAVCMFMNMDKMLGGDFEKGLTALKAVAEGATAKP